MFLWVGKLLNKVGAFYQIGAKRLTVQCGGYLGNVFFIPIRSIVCIRELIIYAFPPFLVHRWFFGYMGVSTSRKVILATGSRINMQILCTFGFFRVSDAIIRFLY